MVKETPTTPKKQLLSANKEKLKVITPLTVKLEALTPKQMKTIRSSVKKSRYPNEPVTPKANIEFSMELKKAINERNILTSKTKKVVFDALDDIKTKTEEESRNYKKNRALLEIINSEMKYVSQLETIINFFMNPIKERKLLKQDDFETLFGNIKTIYSINKNLLEELDEGTKNVAQAFLKVAPFFKLYSVYAYDYKNSLRLIQNARAVNPQFAKFVEMQETRPEVQTKLSSLLITPIQRVPRYKLLLMHLQELTSTKEKDYNLIVECLEKIDDAADHINKVVDDQENAQRLLELHRCFCGGEPNIITPGRTLKKEGILMKMSSKQAHSEKLYAVLMNDIIMFCKMKKDGPKVNSLKTSLIFPLNKSKITEILDKGCFKINCQDEEVILYNDKLVETKKWIEALKLTIENHIEDRKSLRKESSSRRPVKRKDMQEYHEVGVSPGRPLKKRKIEGSHIQGRQPIHSLPCSSSYLQSNEDTENNENRDEANNQVYVFGNPHNSNSGFKFTKMIGDVGSSIKNFFSFGKKN
ncbi:unnamed protein product [Brassicogethes aeneus]|uniref:Rho guanine nucleotide exchange factor n=1 Tax=Brassicogethes aeneus TaxID=1431903 RepID=A0A9P0FAG0_BRAAE|nr:unnamed protein product [Brassicogethes aeneus]